jgi:thymidylate synthase
MAPSMEAEPAVVVAPVSVKQTDTIAAQPVTGKHEEYQYLDLIREILETGEHRPDR